LIINQLVYCVSLNESTVEYYYSHTTPQHGHSAYIHCDNEYSSHGILFITYLNKFITALFIYNCCYKLTLQDY
jgi:hypothetical protein